MIQSSTLFDFSLRPLEAVQPWGQPPDLTLSWFGFTEGFYRLQVGSDYLLNYSPQFVERWSQAFPDAYQGSSVDYYVVRLWEDLLDLLPAILEPLPADLAAYFDARPKDWFAWRRQALAWAEQQPDTAAAFDLFGQATGWQCDRKLDTGYLQNPSKIWLWSTPQFVTISWDNSDITWEGIPVWTAQQGHFSMARSEFLEAVRAFDNKLIYEMAKRVEIICHQWLRPEIYVNTDHLSKEQHDRATWLDQALQKTSPPPWATILSAIQTVEVV